MGKACFRREPGTAILVDQGLGVGLLAEVAPFGLVEMLDLAAGLGVVGRGVLDLGAEALQLQR